MKKLVRLTGMVTVIAVLAMALAIPAIAGQAKAEKPAQRTQDLKVGDEIRVPEGMLAIVRPGGTGYDLHAYSRRDFIYADDGTTIVGPRTLRGNQLLGMIKNAYIASRMMRGPNPAPASPSIESEQLPEKPCDAYVEGGLKIVSVVPLHYACLPNGAGCQYWNECVGG